MCKRKSIKRKRRIYLNNRLITQHKAYSISFTERISYSLCSQREWKRSGFHTKFARNGKENEADFIQSLLLTGKKQLASQFNLTYRYIDDELSIKNPEFKNYLGQMYPAEIEIKNTPKSTTSASYLDLLLSIGRDGQLHTFIFDKRDDFNFHITNFPFLSSIFAGLWPVYLSTYTIRPGLLLVWMFYSEGQATFQ